MKTKPSEKPKQNRLLKAVHSVQGLIRKKKPKQVSFKKRVQFNLSPRPSYSETILSHVKSTKETAQGDDQAHHRLKSKSFINIGRPRSPCVQHHSEFMTGSGLLDISLGQILNQHQGGKVNLQNCLTSFNELYTLRAIDNLKKAPVKGILKNGQSSWNFENNEGLDLSQKKLEFSLLPQEQGDIKNSSDLAQQCSQFCTSLEGEVYSENHCNLVDNIKASIQDLHISIDSRDQGDNGRNMVPLSGVVQPGLDIVSCPSNNNSQADGSHNETDVVDNYMNEE